MSNLKEIHITSTNLRLDNNLVKGGILPNSISELTRTVNVVGETVIEGPLYANKLTIEAAPFEVKGAVFTQRELYINNDVTGSVIFRKAVGSASSTAFPFISTIRNSTVLPSIGSYSLLTSLAIIRAL